MATEQTQPGGLENMTDEEEMDLEIAVMLGQRLIEGGGSEIIDQAVAESSDPGQVIGGFLMQLVSQMNEMLPPEVQLSKRIYFAEGGWIEQISDWIQEEYGVSKSVMDRAEMFIGSQAQAMAQGHAQQQEQMAQQQAAPAPAGQPVLPGGM